jgi:hypothetical protein
MNFPPNFEAWSEETKQCYFQFEIARDNKEIEKAKIASQEKIEKAKIASQEKIEIDKAKLESRNKLFYTLNPDERQLYLKNLTQGKISQVHNVM